MSNPTTTAIDSKPYQIYMLRAARWVPVGACGDQALAETHAASLRKMMRRNQFQITQGGPPNEPA